MGCRNRADRSAIRVRLILVRLAMSDQSVRVFRSDPTPLMRVLAKVCAWGSIVMVATVAVGQWRAGRFPGYSDLALSAGMPIVVLLASWVLLALAVAVFPVTLFRSGLRCYDATGRYRTVEWPRILSAELMTICGLRYLAVEAHGLERPITLPLFLRDMSSFRAEVDMLAGVNSVLGRALHSAT